MQAFIRIIVVLALALGVNACSKFKHYDGPEVTRVVILKSTRTMYLMHGEEALKVYEVDLGFAPAGHKEFEGDGRTPEGSYLIDRRNPRSDFHLSLGINYPNEADIENARKAGKSPGGDIFIHGGPTEARDKGKADWTAGCISVSDREIEEVYSMIRMGTPIDILP